MESAHVTNFLRALLCFLFSLSWMCVHACLVVQGPQQPVKYFA